MKAKVKTLDGRKHNRPPVRQPSLSDEVVAIIDGLVALGVMQKHIGRNLNIHPRTVMAAVNRTGAYARIPKPNKQG